jgi:PAS domain S-box-containing protein
MPAGVLIAVAPSGKIIMGNRQCEKILGHPYLACDKIEDYIGYKGFHLDGSRIKPEEWPLVRSVTKGEIVAGEEILYQREDGTKRYLLLHSSPIRDEKGVITAAVATFLDITQRKHDEKALAEAKAQAELLIDLLGHDINNMNHSALGYLELALDTLDMDGKIGPDGRVLIEKPYQAIQSSSTLITNVRKLQRLRTEGVKTQPIDLYDLFEELKAHDFHASDKKVTINFEPIPHYIVEGSELLRDVFYNLINNAVKHSIPGKPVNIDVNVERVNENGRAFYRCVIEDDGPGIPDELKPRLFHRFQRGKTKAHGKGLGLYLVRTLVESYHGKVWVEDRVKGDHTKGARFVVMLPAAENH